MLQVEMALAFLRLAFSLSIGLARRLFPLLEGTPTVTNAFLFTIKFPSISSLFHWCFCDFIDSDNVVTGLKIAPNLPSKSSC